MMKHQTLAMGAGAPRNVVPRDIKPAKEGRPVVAARSRSHIPDRVERIRDLARRRDDIHYRAEKMALEFVRHLARNRPMEAEGVLRAVIDSLEDMDRLDQTGEELERAKYDSQVTDSMTAVPAERTYWALMVRRRTLLEVYSRSTAGEATKRAMRPRIPGEYDEWPKEIMGHFDTEPSRAYNDAVHKEIQRRSNYEPGMPSADEVAKLRASIVKSGGYEEAARIPGIAVATAYGSGGANGSASIIYASAEAAMARNQGLFARAIEDGLAASCRAHNDAVQKAILDGDEDTLRALAPHPLARLKAPF